MTSNDDVIDLVAEFDKTPSPQSQRMAVLRGYEKPLYLLNQKELEELRKKSLLRQKKEEEERELWRHREHLNQAKALRIRKALQEQVEEGEDDEQHYYRALEDLDRMIQDDERKLPKIDLDGVLSIEDLYDELRRQDPNITIPIIQYKARGTRKNRKSKRKHKSRKRRRHPHKGQRSRTRKGRKDFRTHKGDRVYNRRGHRQYRKRRPYRTRRR